MISVVIPTLNAQEGLPATLSALVPAAASGLIRDVVIADGGSEDLTLKIADGMGCTIVQGPRGRGQQLRAGAAAAKSQWYLFLHADTVLGESWDREVSAFIEACDLGKTRKRAAAFRFALDSYSSAARMLETMVRLRATLFALPYGDQGLLLPRRLYDELGGYKPIPLMEDVDIIRRIGRARLHILRTSALTSAVRYERAGYLRRSLVNLSCLAMYFLGVAPDALVKHYEA